MGDRTKIEWCDSTVNFVIGCDKVSAGCAHCYAESLDARFKYGGDTHWGKSATRYIRSDKALFEALNLDQKAQKEGRVRKVFINSMSDTFEGRKDLDGARLSLFRAIRNTTNLIFLLLTKRPENVLSMVPNHWLVSFPTNVWIGTSVEDQKRADERIPELLKIPAKVRFLSVEPMLEGIDLPLTKPVPIIDDKFGDQGEYYELNRGIHWVIVGGESGQRKRPFNCDWARSIKAQCEEAKAAFFMKQVDKIQPIPPDLMIREFPNETTH